MTAHEELGRPFHYDVELLSETDDVKPGALLGKPLTVHVELPNGQLRHFSQDRRRLWSTVRVQSWNASCPL